MQSIDSINIHLSYVIYFLFIFVVIITNSVSRFWTEYMAKKRMLKKTAIPSLNLPGEENIDTARGKEEEEEEEERPSGVCPLTDMCAADYFQAQARGELPSAVEQVASLTRNSKAAGEHSDCTDMPPGETLAFSILFLYL